MRVKTKFLKFEILCLITALILGVNGECDQDGQLANGSGIDCRVIEHKLSNQDTHTNSSYECIPDLDNSIVLQVDADITLECSALFPIEVDYDGVQPAVNFEVEFYKRNLHLNLDINTNTTYVIAITLRPVQRQIWSANYLFHAVGKASEILMISIFVRYPYLPYFLPLATETLRAYLDPSGQFLIIPCRVQNHDAIVQLFQDFVPVDLESEDEEIKFDPKIGFLREITEDNEVYGDYECYTAWDGKEDRQKVTAVKPEEGEPIFKPAKQKPTSPQDGHMEFTKNEHDGTSNAVCLAAKETGIHMNKYAPSFVNNKVNNPNTHRLKAACLHDLDEKTGRMCPGRKLGSKLKLEVTTVNPIEGLMENDMYEIKEIHPYGGMQCGRRRQQYFTGVDTEIYYDYRVARDNNALVVVEPLSNSAKMYKNGWYGFKCRFVSYIAVMPIWWMLKFEDGRVEQEFASNSSEKYYTLTPDVVEVGCRISAWNSTEWFEHILPIVLSEIEEPPPEIVTKISFTLNSKDQVLACKGDGTPTPVLTWLKNGEEDGSLDTVLNGNSLVLNFKTVTKDDEGQYTCLASSKTATIQVSFVVSVVDEPELFVNPTDLSGSDAVCSPEAVVPKTVVYKTPMTGTGEKIKNSSYLSTGDVILVHSYPVCSDDGIQTINFTATIDSTGKPNEFGIEDAPEVPRDFEDLIFTDNATTMDSGQEEQCQSSPILRSAESGMGIKLDTMKKGDKVFIQFLDCSKDNNDLVPGLFVSVIDVTSSGSEMLGGSPTEDDNKHRWENISLLLLVLLLLLIILFGCCIYYCCTRRDRKVYYVNR